MTKSVGLTAERGEIAVTASMEKLQDAYLGAIAAAAGCELSKPERDPSLDWTIGHKSKKHTQFRTAKIDVALKSTHQTSPGDIGEFSFTIRNEHLEVLAEEALYYPRLLVVMILPRDVDPWVWSKTNWMIMRHSMYWVNLRGAQASGLGIEHLHTARPGTVRHQVVESVDSGDGLRDRKNMMAGQIPDWVENAMADAKRSRQRGTGVAGLFEDTRKPGETEFGKPRGDVSPPTPGRMCR